MRRWILLIGCVVGITGPIRIGSAGQKLDLAKLPPAAPGTMDFPRDIQPIFAKACLSCHGPQKQRAGKRCNPDREPRWHSVRMLDADFARAAGVVSAGRVCGWHRNARR